jgi:hypothetical protein
MSSWFHNNANVLTVIGAIVILSSWFTSNTIKAKLDSLRRALEEARKSEYFEHHFAEIKGYLGGIGAQIIQIRPKHPGTSPEEESFWSAADRLTNAQASSVQIDTLNALCSNATRYSNASQQATSVSKELVRVGMLASVLHREHREELEKATRVVDEVQVMNPKPHQQLVRAAESVKMFEDFYRKNLLPRARTLYDEVVPLMNARRQELDVELAAKKRLVQLSTHAAFVLYAMGSVLALAGQVGDKIFGKYSVVPSSSQNLTPKASSAAKIRKANTEPPPNRRAEPSPPPTANRLRIAPPRVVAYTWVQHSLSPKSNLRLNVV